jgi:hypothetical protein
MSPPKRTVKGLQDIRARSGSVDQTAVPYKAYMRACCLEMERHRLSRERSTALLRVRNIDARFKEIDEEIDALNQSVGRRDSHGQTGSSGGGPRLVGCSSGNRFKLRY